jgi:polyisoprenoid-binding protein YceI
MLRGAFFFLVMGLAASAAAQSGTWKIDPNHSSAQFSVRHLGVSTVRGAFTKVNGSGTYDSSDPAKTSLEANDRSQFGRYARRDARQRSAQSQFP